MKTYDGCLSNLIKNVLFSVFLLLLIVACGSSPHGQSTGTGVISFSIDWQNAPTLAPSLTDATLMQHALQAIISQAPLDCAATGVATVEAVVYDSSNAVVASGGPWSCDSHSGSIAGVPAGTNWKVAVIGKDASGSILYYGETGGVSVAGDQTTNLGAITASLFTLTGVTATAGNSQINLNWTALTGASSYNIYWSTTPGVTKATGTKIANAAKIYSHSGLSNWTPYYYVITAANSNGESKESAVVTATPTNAIPVAPANVTAVASSAQNVISWNTTTGATSYNIYWSSTTGVTKANGTKITNPANPYTHSSLSNWTTYYYVVTAMDSQGESIESAQVAAMPPGTPPAAPTGVSATAGSGQNTISWNTVPGASTYTIYWSLSSGVTPTNGTKIPNVTSQYIHGGLTDVTTYYYVVTANNSYGESAASAQASVTLTPPAAPALNLWTPGDAQVTIEWTPVPLAASYNLYWSTSPGVTTSTGTSIAGVSTPYPHTGLTNRTTYYYILTAVNANGESTASNEIAVTPLAPLEQSVGAPYYIAVDSLNVYFLDQSGVSRYLKLVSTGGGTVTTLTGVGCASALAVDSTDVYWTDNPLCTQTGSYQTVNKIPIAGGSSTQLSTGLVHPGLLAVDSTSVYWTENGYSGQYGNSPYVSYIMKVDKASGGTPTTLFTAEQAQGIAVDSTSVYWRDISATGYIIRKVAINGGAAEDIVTANANAPILDASNVYFASSLGTGIMKVAKSGGVVTAVTSTSSPTPYTDRSIATDGTNIYWFGIEGTTGYGSINKVGVNGGTVTTLASGRKGFMHIAIDADNVYWAEWNGGDGAILKIPK